MQKEPTIHQIEKLIQAFRQNGGTDAELSMVANSIIREFKPERLRPVEEVFTKEYHPSFEEIKELKDKQENGFSIFFKTIWKNHWFKYTFLFLTSFFIVFSILNLPLVLTKLTPVKEVKYETVTEVVNPVNEKSAPLEPGEVVPSTDTVVIPKIGVTAPIVFVPSIVEADIQDGLRNGVVHYDGTAKPGEAGNSFITGHSSNYWWEKGNYNYIFANLNKLAVGDQVKIYYQGNKLLYEVKSSVVVEPTETSVLAQTPTPTLTLMTCYPPGTNWKRLIVKLDQVSPAYTAPYTIEKQKPIEVKKLPQADSGKLVDWLGRFFKF